MLIKKSKYDAIVAENQSLKAEVEKLKSQVSRRDPATGRFTKK